MVRSHASRLMKPRYFVLLEPKRLQHRIRVGLAQRGLPLVEANHGVLVRVHVRVQALHVSLRQVHLELSRAGLAIRPNTPDRLIARNSPRLQHIVSICFRHGPFPRSRLMKPLLPSSSWSKNVFTSDSASSNLNVSTACIRSPSDTCPSSSTSNASYPSLGLSLLYTSAAAIVSAAPWNPAAVGIDPFDSDAVSSVAGALSMPSPRKEDPTKFKEAKTNRVL
eukprot:CAMPEP_0202853324 /NCGR_PEP_ID=MMETSP1389-20130828/90424_1 /ASSEMBLY_ACC=CAM_ASM_000865 /TAXON_ID=302021 /ORGANISM="Rhodomonas sp., Strain CCMP768" /LENGTH=221 /DNA_ID=CAMNT_0049531873 /DNA_START=375 /DNA_END=1040 /DNA_ORIENTATION=+